MSRRRTDHPGQVEFAFVVPVEVTPRGDGTWVVRAGKPQAWLWVAEVARQFGLSSRTIRTWIDEGLVESRRVGRRKLQVSSVSLEQFLQAQNRDR